MKTTLMVVAVILFAIVVVFHSSMDKASLADKTGLMPQVLQDSELFHQLFDAEVYDSKYISDSRYLMHNNYMLCAWYLLDDDTLIYVSAEQGADYVVGDKQVYCLDLNGKLLYHGDYLNPNSDYRSNNHHYFDDQYTYGQDLGHDTISTDQIYYQVASSMGFPFSGEHYEYYQHKADSLIALMTLPSYSEVAQ